MVKLVWRFPFCPNPSIFPSCHEVCRLYEACERLDRSKAEVVSLKLEKVSVLPTPFPTLAVPPACPICEPGATTWRLLLAASLLAQVTPPPGMSLTCLSVAGLAGVWPWGSVMSGLPGTRAMSCRQSQHDAPCNQESARWGAEASVPQAFWGLKPRPKGPWASVSCLR